jgi:hypothetical protein
MDREHWIAITHNRSWKSMKTNNSFEESFRNRCSRVWMTERDEMSVLGETVHNRQNNALAMHTGKTFDEIHRDVRPYLGGNFQWLE